MITTIVLIVLYILATAAIIAFVHGAAVLRND